MGVQVRNIQTGVVSTDPFAYTFRGEAGIIFVKDSQIFWSKNDHTTLVDVDGDSKADVIVSGIESMSNFFTLDTSTPPVTPLDPSAKPILSVPDDLTYKTLLGTAGSYTTRINLRITNDGDGAYPVLISSQIGGGSLTTDASGNKLPNTWASLTRQSDGRYFVILPTTNTAPYIEPFFVRFSGNSISQLGNYVVFKTDGTNPLGTDVPPPSDAVPEVPELPTSSYKTLIGSPGSYITRIKLSISNNPSGVYDIEVSSQLQGSLSNGQPSSWVTLSINLDGFYYPTLPCTGKAEPLFLRFTGNTGYKSCYYITFNADGSDPLAGLITAPIRTYPKDIVLSYWLQDCNDWYNCDPINPYSPNCNSFGYVGQSNGAMARIKNYMRRDLTMPPFYATYHAVKTISGNDGNYGQTDYNVTFNQAAFDKCLEYAYECGAKAFDFYFYDNDADVSEHIRFNQTTTSPYKDSVQYYYTMGSFGYTAVTTMNRIVSHMAQSRYYKINNRPVLAIDNPSEKKFHIDRYILQSGATYNPSGDYYTQNAGYNGPIKFFPESGYVRASGETPVKNFFDYMNGQYLALYQQSIYLITQGPFYYQDGNDPTFTEDAISAYSVPPPNMESDHTYSNLVTYNINTLNSILATNQTIVPVITTGFENIYIGGQEDNYTNAGTPAEIIDHMNRVKDVVRANSSKIPFVKIYSFGETNEAGGGALVPRKNSNGTIDKENITAVRTGISN